MRTQPILIAGLVLSLGLGAFAPLRVTAQARPVLPSPANALQLYELFKRGKALIDAGKYDAALQIYQQAQPLDPKNARIVSAIGFIQAQQGAYKESYPFRHFF